MRLWWLLALLPLGGCSTQKTRLDCIEVCRDHGLRYVEVVSGPVGYDQASQQLQMKDACRCE